MRKSWRACTQLAILAVALAVCDVGALGGEPGWITDARTGCKVWDVSLEPKESISWKGACLNGLASGRGILQWFIEGSPADRYEGEYREGKRNGPGVYVDSWGTKYDGEWRNDLRNGHGVETLRSGAYYDGEWSDDKKNGHALEAWSRDQKPMETEWSNDTRCGTKDPWNPSWSPPSDSLDPCGTVSDLLAACAKGLDTYGCKSSVWAENWAEAKLSSASKRGEYCPPTSPDLAPIQQVDDPAEKPEIDWLANHDELKSERWNDGLKAAGEALYPCP